MAEENEIKNEEIEKESSLSAMLLAVSFLCFTGIVILLLKGSCTDYFSAEYSIRGFMTQFSLFMLSAIGAASFYFASIAVLKLRRQEDKEHKGIMASIAFALFAYSAAFIQFAQGNCVYHYSKESTLLSLMHDYFPAVLLLFGTFYLYLAIDRTIKLISKKDT